jgi:diguanylate cyclase (GGDEF)-like protein
MGAGSNNPEAVDSGSRRKLLQLLGSLRDTPAGTVIYRQVEGMLEDLATQHLQAEMAYAGFVDVLLDSISTQLARGSAGHLQLKLLQARLQPPLTPSELVILGQFVRDAAGLVRPGGTVDRAVVSAAVQPLLSAFGIDSVPEPAPATAPAQVPPEPVPAESVVAALPEEDTEQAYPGTAHAGPAAEPDETATEEGGISADIPAGQDLADINRSELELRREEIAKLQAALGEQVIETISKNEEFGTILEVALDDLRQATDVNELENTRWTLIREVEKLLGGHHNLADQLDNTHHYLQLYESDSRQLTDELTRVRLLSLTDELTGLPNRRAFMRRLEDEVARVQRYGFPLSFVLIDLDHFKAVNDEHGHAAGDEVLRVYSRNVLSIFRHHDMVARYGGEEFAVLLPNTDSDGTIRALNKVRRRAAETRWQTNGTVAAVPTFSAGVSLYKPGESAGAFIERADKALYRAKRLGRNRIELDMTYNKDADLEEPRRRSTDQA